jgi:hypothetical protein
MRLSDGVLAEHSAPSSRAPATEPEGEVSDERTLSTSVAIRLAALVGQSEKQNADGPRAFGALESPETPLFAFPPPGRDFTPAPFDCVPSSLDGEHPTLACDPPASGDAAPPLDSDTRPPELETPTMREEEPSAAVDAAPHPADRDCVTAAAHPDLDGAEAGPHPADLDGATVFDAPAAPLDPRLALDTPPDIETPTLPENPLSEIDVPAPPPSVDAPTLRFGVPEIRSQISDELVNRLRIATREPPAEAPAGRFASPSESSFASVTDTSPPGDLAPPVDAHAPPALAKRASRARPGHPPYAVAAIFALGVALGFGVRQSRPEPTASAASEPSPLVVPLPPSSENAAPLVVAAEPPAAEPPLDVGAARIDQEPATPPTEPIRPAAGGQSADPGGTDGVRRQAPPAARPRPHHSTTRRGSGGNAVHSVSCDGPVPANGILPCRLPAR